MRILIIRTLTTLDGSDEGKDRNPGVLFDCFHADGDGDEHVEASHASAMAGSRYLPPRVASSTRKEKFFKHEC